MDSLLMKLKDIRKVGELLEAVLTGDKDKLDKICKTIKELQKDIDDDEPEDCCNMNCTNKATKFQNLDDPSCSITGDGRDWYCQKCYSDCVGDDDKE